MPIYEWPVVLMLFLAWLNAPAASLGEAARKEAWRRAMVAPAARSLSNADLPATALVAEPPPVLTGDPVLGTDDPPVTTGTGAAGAAATTTGQSAGADKDEKWWRDRMTLARETLARDEVMVTAMQSRVNALNTDIVNRDDPAQRAKLMTDREKALEELARLQKQVADDQKAIADIQEEARRLGVPPGWIR